MKIWVVFPEYDEGSGVPIAAFDNKDTADAFVAKKEKNFNNYYEIFELELNKSEAT